MVGALLFDGKYVREFISIIKQHGAIAGLVSNQLLAYVLQYCTMDVKKVIHWSEELDGTDWDAVKELLIGLYGSSDELTLVTIDDFEILSRKPALTKNSRDESMLTDTTKDFSQLLAN